MIFIFEAIVLCILFTITLIGIAKDPLSGIHNYPPAIIQRVKRLGFITDEQLPRSKKTIMKKLLAAVVIVIILGAIVYFVNGADTLGEGFLISYALWFVVDWYDAFVIDILWVCHDKRFIIKGTEDMVKDYHDYWFHIKGSFRGMMIGVPVCLVSGLTVQMITWLQ